MIRKPGDLPDDTLLGRGHERRAFEFPGRGPLLEPARDIRPVEREVRMATLTSVLLVFLGALSRLIPHPPNFVALGALALYSGARLPRRWAWAVPLGAMVLSDVFLDAGTGRAAISGMRITIYATFAAIVLAGRRLRERSGPGRLAAFSVGASVLFFVTSNFAEWVGGPEVPEDAGRPRALLCRGHPVLLGNPRRRPPRDGDALRARCAFAPPAGPRVRGRRSRRFRGSGFHERSAGAAAGASGVRRHRRHRDFRSGGREGRRLRDHRDHPRGAREERNRGRLRRSALGPGPRPHAVRHTGLRDVPLHARNQLDADARPDRRRADELAVFLGLRLVRHDHGEHRPDRDRARARIPRSTAPTRSAAWSRSSPAPARTASPAGRRAKSATRARVRAPAFVSLGEGPFTGSASYRYVAFDGDRPNTDWRERNGSASLSAKLGEASRIGVEWGLIDGEVGNPGPVGRALQRPRLHARGAALGAGKLRALRHEPSGRPARRRSLRAGVPGHGRRLRVADRRPDAAGERLRHGHARRAHADGFRLLAALAGFRREQLRREPRRRANDAVGRRRAGLRDLRRVHADGGPALRPLHVVRRGLEPARHDLLALDGQALEGPRLRRHRLPRAFDRGALLPVLRQPRPACPSARSPRKWAASATSETTAGRKSPSSGTT